ncbi:unnamed protein product [Rotaria sordida]|uniref:Uncharacterized protein n=1 Tax=Rotaria sordida TaxID=392033 RepID=A0A819S5G5_9BILA|nr:unnamed protein product [Rotaria sordida]
MFWDKPRRSSSNQNMNQASTEQKDSYSIDTHLIVVPIRSSHCQTEISKNDLQTINVDLNQSEKTINLHEQLTDTLCRRLHEPLMFMNRDMFCRHNRPSFCSTVSSGMRKLLFEHGKMIVRSSKIEISLIQLRTNIFYENIET